MCNNLQASDPECWIQRGRTVAAATLLAAVWAEYPDLPNEASAEDRMARIKQRTIALKPLFEQETAAIAAEHERRNFEFTAKLIAEGRGTDLDEAKIIGRDRHGYGWGATVQYANGWYAAHAGREYRPPTFKPEVAHLDAFNTGFRDGGGNLADPFDGARRSYDAAARAQSNNPPANPVAPRPLPSTWPQPTDSQRPTPWSRRLILMGEPEATLAGLDRPGEFQSAALLSDLLHAQGFADATVIILTAAGISHGLTPRESFLPLTMRQAQDATFAEAVRNSIAAHINHDQYDDILIAAQGPWLTLADNLVSTLPLCRNSERTWHTARLQRVQLKIWIARAQRDNKVRAAGHIRWGKSHGTPNARLGRFRAWYVGKIDGQGHRIQIAHENGEPAQGFATTAGEPLNPHHHVSNKTLVKPAIVEQLRLFAAALGPANSGHQTLL